MKFFIKDIVSVVSIKRGSTVIMIMISYQTQTLAHYEYTNNNNIASVFPV